MDQFTVQTLFLDVLQTFNWVAVVLIRSIAIQATSGSELTHRIGALPVLIPYFFIIAQIAVPLSNNMIK